MSTAWLAAMGADVIKVEAVQRPDGIRFSAALRPDQDPLFYERVRCCSTRRTSANAASRSTWVSPRASSSRSVWSHALDVIVENFYAARKLENFGLDYEVARSIRPDVVMVRMPAFGLTGPWRDRPGFAQTMEQITGMAWATGYEGGPPIIPGGMVDPMVKAHAALGTVARLRTPQANG